MARLLQSGCVLAGLVLLRCGGAAFTIGDGSDGGSGVSSGSSSGAASSGTSGSGSAGSSTGATSGASTGSASGASAGSSSGMSSGTSGASGAKSGSSSGGSSAASGSGSGGGDAGTTECPAHAPAANAKCTDNGLECEYGSSPDIACNQLAECESNVWTYLASGTCTMNACDTAGVSCAYPQGTCVCGSSGPVRVSLDGGSFGPTWSCQPATAACPSPRPDLGTACSTPTQICDYGSCEGGIAMECKGGAWQRAMTACPL
jgi:hypothetical protein